MHDKEPDVCDLITHIHTCMLTKREFETGHNARSEDYYYRKDADIGRGIPSRKEVRYLLKRWC